MVKSKDFGRRCLPIWFFVLMFCFICFSNVANSTEYSGLIAVKNGVPLTPSPWLPNFDGKDNLRFFLNNSNPSPVDVGLGKESISAEGVSNNAIYNIIPFGTITVLADNGTNYGRTSQGRNINSEAIETMTFVGGAYKAYELVAMTLPYKKEPPIAPTNVIVTLEGYRAGDFRPLIKVTIGSYADTEHEKSPPYYKYELYEGATLLDSAEINDTTWRPDAGKLNDTSVDRTYTIKVKAHNWFGYSSSSTDKSVLVPAPAGAAAGVQQSVTLNLKAGINFFSLGIPPDASGKWYKDSTEISTVQDLINAIGRDKVSTFGYVDENSQKIIGVKKINGNFTGPLALNTPLDNKKGYQVYLTGTSPVTLTLKNYK